VATINYVVNQFGLYPPHFFEPIVLTIRDFKMNLYKTYSPPPELVVLGSSRNFTVDPQQLEQLWHYSAFNASVTSGNMQDYLAFIRYILQVGKFPKLLILSVAPEVFHWTEEARYTNEPDSHLWNYVDYQDPLYPIRDPFYRMTRLFAKEQFDASVRVLAAQSIDRTKLKGYQVDPNGWTHIVGTRLSAADLDPDTLYNSNWGALFAQNDPDLYRMSNLQQI